MESVARQITRGTAQTSISKGPYSDNSPTGSGTSATSTESTKSTANSKKPVNPPVKQK